MNKLFLSALALLSLAAAAQTPPPSSVLTPEKLWQLGRLGEMQASPDGTTVAYTVTRYNLAENKGNADIWTVPVAGGQPKRLTDTPGSENTLNWRPDGKLAFISGESGTDQLYVMSADGTGKTQLSDFPDQGLSNLKYAPKANFILHTQDVKSGLITLDMFPDLPEADAKIIDYLNYRHWNAWDDHQAGHVFFQPINAAGKPEGYGKDLMPGEKFDSPLTPMAARSSWLSRPMATALPTPVASLPAKPRPKAPIPTSTSTTSTTKKP